MPVIRSWGWIIAALLLLFWLGARDLNTNPIWGDERNSIRDAGGMFFGSRSLVEIWNGVHDDNPWHAPGYFFILSGWGKLIDWEIPLLRLLALFFALLAVAWTYRLGAERVSAHAGLYGAAVLATLMLFVHYAIQIRMYSLMSVLSVFTLWVYLRLVDTEHQPSWWEWSGLLVGAVGLLYTHYFAALTLGVIGLYHLLFARKNRTWWVAAGVLALAGALFLPWTSGLIAGLERNAAPGDFLYKRAMDAGTAVERFAYLFSNTAAPLLALSLLLALIGTWRLRGRSRRGALQIWFAVAMLVGAVLLANEIVRVMSPERLRYLAGAFPLLALLIGVGIASLEGFGRVGQGLALLLLAAWMGSGMVQIFNRTPNIEIDGFRAMFPLHTVAARLEHLLQPGDIVVTYPADDEPLLNHHYRNVASFYFGSELNYALRRSSMTEPQSEQVRFTSASQRLRLWLAHPAEPPANLSAFTAALEAEFTFCRRQVDEPDLEIDLYTALPLCCLAGDEPPQVRYPEGIALMGLETLPIQDGNRLPVVTTWDIGADSPYYSYSMALHVLDESGRLVAQADRGLELPDYTCRQTDIDISSLPAGIYSLHLIVYNWETGARLSGVVSESGETGDALFMTGFSIER